VGVDVLRGRDGHVADVRVGLAVLHELDHDLQPTQLPLAVMYGIDSQPVCIS
jgi:hypothetical protein